MSLNDMKKVVSANRNAEVAKIKDKSLNRVINFMGGNSYEVNPLLTLKMVSASSIFGEPQYYRSAKEVRDGAYKVDHLLNVSNLLLDSTYIGKSTSEVMESVIDASLSYDFEGTLRWAVELRKDYLMRLNPQIILVRASVHGSRVEFNENNPGLFREIQSYVMSRADEPAVQLTYWLFLNGSKNGIPSVLKRSWKDRLEKASRYEISKYKNSGVGMIDTVRISHASSEDLSSLLKGDSLELSDSELTWNQYISANGSSTESWEWVIDNIFTAPGSLKN